MHTYKAVIAYDGSAFSGFALQKHKKSVLGALQEGLGRVGISGEILGASRTDKGVHSTGQVISFKSSHLHRYESAFLLSLLNAKLYPRIMIRSLKRVPHHFHPRFDAKWRAYRFLLSPTFPPPFASSYVTHQKIGDMARFIAALHCFKGEHNFLYFKKNGSFTQSNVRTIFDIKYYRYKSIDVVYVRGNGFLRSQVRLMVGAALSVSRGEMSMQHLQEQLLAQKQHYAYPISPQGLYLCGVGYDELCSHSLGL
ncbi:tRNA pseudouridine(38-40) synthase TruA [uncultured Helicobacter sp.]|uniref:tRNA pseudouridine(38-40) synthase TruA n=1 Tax=uncultured Helicobacter sp. TaxID=175537 RepID=UPI002614F6CD|nr:tRNA pseudouridine(38-40) synthase TruA [uncultured Helicobacter sp.]